MRLAPLRPRDRAPLARLLRETEVFSADEIDVALQLFDASVFEAQELKPDGATDYEFVGAFGHDDGLTGYACYGSTPSTDGTWDLYWLAVARSVQGGGIGRALVEWVELDVASRGGRLLVVETSSRADYDRSRAFYARSGFTEAARVRDFYAPADDRIILTTRLTRERGAATR